MLPTPRVEGPPCRGEHTLEALQVRDGHRAPDLPGVAPARAPASRPTRRCHHASPAFGPRGLEDARSGEALREEIIRDAALHRQNYQTKPNYELLHLPSMLHIWL